MLGEHQIAGWADFLTLFFVGFRPEGGFRSSAGRHFSWDPNLAINFSPAEMRGRYMAVYDLGWTIPATFGPAAAGLILDGYDPNLLWYLGGILCAVSALSFYALHLWLGRQARFAPVPPPSSDGEVSPRANQETS